MREHKMVFWSGFLVIIFGLMLAGCPNKTVEPPASASDGKGTAESLVTDRGKVDPQPGSRTSQGMHEVYFDYDSSAIRADQVENMELNAAFLKDNPDVRIRIEGNCDPRGTKEYNLALGERRAQNTKKYLVNLGVDVSRLDTISWGEEKLLLHGHDELSWAQNRRNDFVVVK